MLYVHVSPVKLCFALSDFYTDCGDVTDIAAAGATFEPQTDCGTVCSGDSTFLCGGGNRISYYNWTGTPFNNWQVGVGAGAGQYQFLVPGVVIPLVTTQGINGKIT